MRFTTGTNVKAGEKHSEHESIKGQMGAVKQDFFFFSLLYSCSFDYNCRVLSSNQACKELSLSLLHGLCKSGFTRKEFLMTASSPCKFPPLFHQISSHPSLKERAQPAAAASAHSGSNPRDQRKPGPCHSRTLHASCFLLLHL